MHNVVSDRVYNNCLSLSVALSILLENNNERRSAYVTYAEELLTYFVRKAKGIYGSPLLSIMFTASFISMEMSETSKHHGMTYLHLNSRIICIESKD